MTQDLIPNPALEPYRILVGEWTTTGTHGMFPGLTLKGRTSFEWLEGGAFLLVRSEIFDDVRFPRTVAILGTDDTAGECYLLTYDSRGVSRKHETSLRDNVWRWWRNAPGFSQRYEATILDGGNTILGKGELSRDGTTWEQDLDLTYKRTEDR